MNSHQPIIENLAKGHPVRVYYEESKHIQSLIVELTEVDPKADFQRYINIFNELSTIEKRFSRKENQLFPYLEKHSWNGPSQHMWSFHDMLRDQIRLLNTYNKAEDFGHIASNIPYLVAGIERLLSNEDIRLFPTALELLSEEEWKEFYEGDEEIGWMLKNKPEPYIGAEEAYVHPSEDTNTKELSFDTSKAFHLEEGFMTPEQVNLLLQFLPVDITYVNENDKVIFYNRGEKRVFPRSKGIIGREVRFCHPPKSVGKVLRIVEEFKSGAKDQAEFWISFKERMIHIRYFAIRDKENKYRGVIEMSQDVTDIQKLQGEKRLLDWDD